MKTTMLALVLSGLVFSAGADNKGVQKFRNFTPEQIRDLPESVRSSEVPMMYSFAAKTGLSLGSELSFGMKLNTLMYPGVHDYKAAVRSFQTDLGDQPTGVLTVWQIYTLVQRSEMQQLSRVSFPGRLNVYKSKDYAIVQGTMTMIDDRIAWPVNFTKISCSRKEMRCEFEQIYLAIPDENSWSQTYQVMEPTTETYEISRWEGDTIDATPRETILGCRTTAMNFNFKTKEFYYITRNAGGECDLAGTKMPKLAKPRIAQIVDGDKIIEAEFTRIEKSAYQVLSSEFRKRVDQLNAKDPKK